MTKSRKAPALQSRYQTNPRYDVKIETSSTVLASLLFTASLHVSNSKPRATITIDVDEEVGTNGISWLSLAMICPVVFTGGNGHIVRKSAIGSSKVLISQQLVVVP